MDAPLVSPFGRQVGHVVFLHSEEEVVWVDAGSHVAAMGDEQSCGNGPVPRDPGGSMGRHRSALAMDQAIAAVVAACLPQAAAGFGVDHAVVITSEFVSKCAGAL
jgi:hypothetical protein